jgi:hypothetical protein
MNTLDRAGALYNKKALDQVPNSNQLSHHHSSLFTKPYTAYGLLLTIHQVKTNLSID